METLKKLYVEEIVPNLTKKFNYTTKMQVPRLEKIVLNMGVGDAINDQKYLDAALKDLEALSGQKPVVTTAKKSIAGFKLREGNKIGCKVTLRGDNMYNFLNKLITIALPRVRDFRGISKNSFDGRGNYTLGMIARSGQANMLAMDMRESNHPIIVCGDFNDVPYSYVYNTMLGDKIDGFKECGSGFMHTFRGGKKMVRIDYIFHDKELEGLSYYKKDLSYSDHYPVFMKIATK